MKHIKINERIFLIEDFLTPEECAHYIQFAENKGFDEATIDYGTHHAVERSIRNNLRVIYDDVDWAIQLWKKLGPYACLLYTSPSPRDLSTSRMPSSA